MARLSFLRAVSAALFSALVLAVPASALTAETERIIDGFLSLHAEITAEESNEAARRRVAEYAASAKIPKEDAEQGRLILDSLRMLEEEPYRLDSDDPKARNRAFGEQMERNEAFIDAHEADGSVSKWLYLFTGDVTSYYMTRSVASTLRHGLRVKELYGLALKLDPLLTNANINIGNWFFYAPRVFGGGLKKAGERYEVALLGARTKGERYMAALILSQFCFCSKKMKECERHLAEAEREVPGSREVARVRRLNAQGISLFQYNRDKSGVDEHQEDED